MKYRTKEELKEYEKLDPIERIIQYLLDEGIVDKDKIDEIQDKVEETIKEAIDFAEDSDFPDLDDLYSDVFVEDDYPFHT
jgi:pyruvate dehydrogenase E1 component alpha subunit